MNNLCTNRSPSSHFVHSFWFVENNTGKDIPSTVLPNGMVDMMLMKMNSENWEMMVRGIDTMPSQVTIIAGTKMFSIGFKLLAVEYLLGNSIKDALNEAQHISNDFWQFEAVDMNSLENFCNKATQKIKTISTENIDSRKQQLFELIYSSNGSITVKELSEKVYWSSRQINRYFNEQFGISLKAYCNILRFKTSLYHIKKGKLFPELNFADQTHFIKEVKKFSGVVPKELFKNQNDRFILLSALPKK